MNYQLPYVMRVPIQHQMNGEKVKQIVLKVFFFSSGFHWTDTNNLSQNPGKNNQFSWNFDVISDFFRKIKILKKKTWHKQSIKYILPLSEIFLRTTILTEWLKGYQHKDRAASRNRCSESLILRMIFEDTNFSLFHDNHY